MEKLKKTKPTPNKVVKPAILRKIITLDANGLVLGRLATQIATILSGKDKASFQRYLDVGNQVLVKNVDKIKLTGQKLEQKVYWHHTTYPGGLKKVLAKDLFSKDPKKVLIKAVYNMLPKNKLRNGRMKRLKFS